MTAVRLEMFKGGVLARFRQYDKELTEKMKKIPGGKFLSADKGGPGWKFHLDLQQLRLLREHLGDSIDVAPELKEWARSEREKELHLQAVRSQDDAGSDLTPLAEYSERLYEFLRPYQRVGVEFVAECPNPLIADEPGIGKTVEVIGGIIQSGLHNGPNLIICPKISIESVWLYELNRFQDEPVFVAPEGKREREKLLKEVALCKEDDIPFWLVVNPAMVSLRKSRSGGEFHDHTTGVSMSVQFPFLFNTNWNTVVIDEFHLSGVSNPSTQLARALRLMEIQKRIAMSGTPMGGKPLRLWGVLHWLEPKTFSSKIRWADTWVKKMTFTTVEGKEINKYDKIQKERERQFYEEHSQYILRRKKEDVFAELPPKQPVDMWVEMTPRQAEQYALMEQEAIAHIEKEEERVGQVTSQSLLTTNSWLKQFSFGYCELVEKAQVWNDEIDDFETKYKAKATTDSPKLTALNDLLEQIGVGDGASGEQAIVFSQFTSMVDVTADWLKGKGYKVAKITGKVKKRDERYNIQQDFQSGKVYDVIVMTTKTGGVSINLDMANTVIFLDETWDPDDQTQASDRAHRASRIHRVTVYTLRTKDTIEHDVFKKLKEKMTVNDILLDRYRQGRA